jgi:hypothetical protein
VPFEKGKSGNPNGRRKEKKFSQALAAALEAEDKAKLYQLRDKLISLGMSGESWALKEILDRYEGKVPQGIEGEDGDATNKIIHEVMWKARNSKPEPSSDA